MSYDDEPHVECYFNVSFRGNMALHNRVNRRMVTHPSFKRYQTLKAMLAEGTYETHQLGVFDMLERLATEVQVHWLTLHNSLAELAEEIAREA